MSMDSRLEIWILLEKLSSDEAFGTEIIPSLVERWGREYSHRTSAFGKEDPVTQRWISFRDTATSLPSLEDNQKFEIFDTEITLDTNLEQYNDGSGVQ
jgi:hypothetical protein